MFPTSWYPLLPASTLGRGESEEVRWLGAVHRVSRSTDGRARVQAPDGRDLPVQEVNDVVFAWSGADEPDFHIGAVPELARPDWTAVRWRKLRPFRTTIDNVMRDVVDNAHFGPVHQLAHADTRAWLDGAHLRTRSRGIIRTDRFGGPRLHANLLLEGRVHGLGLLTYQGLLTIGVQLPHVLLSAAMPLDAEHVQMWVGVSVKRVPLPGANGFLLGRFLDGLEEDYLADAEFWESPEGRMAPTPSDALDAELYGVFDAWIQRFTEDQRAA